MMHNDAIIVWAALRERPSPVLMSAKPALARGTKRMQTIQRIVEGDTYGPLRTMRCERLRRTKPQTSMPIPASTKPPCAGAGLRSATAVRTMIQPTMSNRNPAIFMFVSVKEWVQYNKRDARAERRSWFAVRGLLTGLGARQRVHDDRESVLAR